MIFNYLYFLLCTILTLLFISCSNESLQKVGITKKLSYPVDTIEDLNEVRKIYEKKHHI